MTEPLLSQGMRLEAARQLARLVDQFSEEIGSPPTLGELLDILGASAPARSEPVEGIPVPLRFRARVKGNLRYSEQTPSRVAELNDAILVEASDFFSDLGDALRSTVGRGASLDEFVSEVSHVLAETDISFADVRASDVVSLAAEATKKAVRAKPGDVVSIPVSGGHRLAVIVDHNRFGTALGLLGNASRFPRVISVNRSRSNPRPIYTDDQLIKNGTWPVVGHVQELLTLFPRGPEIYHAPDLLWPGIDVGEFGSAESPSGGLRQIDRGEAEAVGLLGGGYSQGYVSNHLQQLLDDETWPPDR
jgi:hypothetical protein